MIAAGVATAGLAAVSSGYFLDDEGILSWIFAGIMSEAPLDVLFFLKARPPISALYAPVAALGLTPFLCVHVLVAAIAIPLTASLARRFGHRNPNLPAALVALSPLAFACAASGVQNSEAMLGVLCIAWLITRDRPLAAGVVAALLLIARVETAIFVAAVAAYAVVQLGDRRFLLGTITTLLVFVALGASYHGHLSWPLTYPSSVATNEAIDASRRAAYGGTLVDFITTLLSLTPVIGAALWMSVKGRPSFELTLIFAALAFVAAIRVLPFTGLVYVDASPRYLLPALPFLCLAVSNAVDTRRGVSGVGALPKRVSIPILLLVAALASPPLLPTTRMFLGHEARRLDELVGWIGESGAPPGAIIVTDYPLLEIWRARRAPHLDVDIRFLAAPDMVYEATKLTNPATEQLQRLFGTKRFFYAPWVMIEDVASLPGDVYFVLRHRDSRRRDFDDPPLSQVEWLVEKDWWGGRLIRAQDSSSSRGPS